MKLAFVGLGKLGLPVAATLAQKHKVVGYDADAAKRVRVRPYPHRELGPSLGDNFEDFLDGADLTFADSTAEAVRGADIIFVAVQTPHEPLYEGVTRLPSTRADFNYTYLARACREVSRHTTPDQIVVVISTVLPGTLRREVIPALEGRCRLVYHPLFVAMGTVVNDYLNPEFVLLGGDDAGALETVKRFYADLYGRDLSAPMSIESAELCKVGYNTFVTLKITFANTMMEICHRTPGCDVDDVTQTLARANKRLISPRYLSGGMGDGGPCHGRDNIAMSWLAQTKGMGYDFFGTLINIREQQAEWLVDMLAAYDMPKVILGKSYKPESNIVTGSPALLCANLLDELNVRYTMHDPFAGGDPFPTEASAILVATKHECFASAPYPEGSVVLDPFRYVKPRAGVQVIPIGRGV